MCVHACVGVGWVCVHSTHVRLLKNMNLLLVSLPPNTYPPGDQLHVIPGSPVKFTVTANTDFGTLTYKWQRNGADLDSLPEGVPGETTSTLQIDNVKKHHEGTYTCIVSNEVGATPQKPVSNTTSSPAQLTVRKYNCTLCMCLIQPFCALPEALQYIGPCRHVWVHVLGVYICEHLCAAVN